MVERVYSADNADKIYDAEHESKYDTKSLNQDSYLEDSIFNYSNQNSVFTNNVINMSNSIFDNSLNNKFNTEKTISKGNSKGDAQLEQCSWNSFWGDDFPRAFKSWFSWSGDSDKDGVIGDTYQHDTGDCWLLSGVNALSYTEKGRQAIKDAIEYHDDGSATVHFKSGYGDYDISKEEIEKSRDGGFLGLFHKYSTGDTDMNIIELAVEKAYDDIASGKSYLDGNSDKGYHHNGTALRGKQDDGKTTIDGGWSTQLMNMITGKATESIHDKEQIKHEIDSFNNSSVALGCDWKFTETDENGVEHELSSVVEDVNGNEIELRKNHAYAIKDTSADTVTVTNPWESGKDIVLPRETFDKYIDCVFKCDMSGENYDTEYAHQSDYDVDEGKYGYISDDEDHSDDVDFFGEPYESYTKTEVRDNDGNLETTMYKDHQGNRKAFKDWGKKADGSMYVKAEGIYGDGGTRAMSVSYDEHGNVTDYSLLQLDSNGNFQSSIGAGNLSNKELHNIKDRDLLSYHKFELYEVKQLAKLNDEDWKKVRKYVRKNPNATYNEVIKNTGVNP